MKRQLDEEMRVAQPLSKSQTKGQYYLWSFLTDEDHFEEALVVSAHLQYHLYVLKQDDLNKLYENEILQLLDYVKLVYRPLFRVYVNIYLGK